MKSLVDVQFGNPRVEAGMVYFDFVAQTTMDVSGEEGDPVQVVQAEKNWVSLMPKTVAMGQEFIETVVRDIFTQNGGEYTKRSLEKLIDGAIEFTRKVDLTKLMHPKWAEAGEYTSKVH